MFIYRNIIYMLNLNTGTPKRLTCIIYDDLKVYQNQRYRARQPAPGWLASLQPSGDFPRLPRRGRGYRGGLAEVTAASPRLPRRFRPLLQR